MFSFLVLSSRATDSETMLPSGRQQCQCISSVDTPPVPISKLVIIGDSHSQFYYAIMHGFMLTTYMLFRGG